MNVNELPRALKELIENVKDSVIEDLVKVSSNDFNRAQLENLVRTINFTHERISTNLCSHYDKKIKKFFEEK